MFFSYLKSRFSSSPLFAVAGIALVAFSACQQTKEPKIDEPFFTSPPNILFILVDDLGYYDLSHTGSQFHKTPNVDQLANSGMEFTQGYANSPVCSPARASLMTGQFPSRHGITDWIGALTGEEWREHNRHTRMLPASNKENLSQDHLTLPKALQDAGYTTFIAGKWHLGGEGSSPEDHGFDINVGGWEFGSPRGGFFDPYENPKMENRKPGEHLSMRLSDETVMFMEEYHPNKTNKPFFAFLSFYAVHSPLQTTREKWSKYRNRADSLGISEFGFEMGRYLPVRTVQDNPLYGGLVEHMDDAVGHVLNGLKELGLEDNTIVIFTSDHGGVSSGDAFATSNLPLRKGKGSTFEGGLRVPFFLRVPGQTSASTSNDTPVTIADLYPTLLDLVGEDLRPEQHIDGKSLTPILRGENLQDRYLVWHYPHYSNQDGRPSTAIRKGDWKLIYDYETQEKELYNLQTDISEFRNIAHQFPEHAQYLYEAMMSHLKESEALFPEKDPNYDSAAEQIHLERIRQNRMSNLERRRLQFLSPDFDPGNNWWGSELP